MRLTLAFTYGLLALENMEDNKQHWENIYDTKSDHEVGWFQDYPETSLLLIEKYGLNNKDVIVDVGGGTSLLISELVKKGYDNLSVLDISGKALARNAARINHANIKWIEGNILDGLEVTDIGIWHDRAVFHFLTAKEDVLKYVSIASKAVRKQGFVIVGAFSERGPKKCSGLEVNPYSELKFRDVFEPAFQLVECFYHDHTTPSGIAQNFIWGVFKRV